MPRSPHSDCATRCARAEEHIRATLATPTPAARRRRPPHLANGPRPRVRAAIETVRKIYVTVM